MANTKKTLDRYGNEINSLEESLFYISCRLDELTGNAMGSSSLNVDVEPTDLSEVESNLSKIQESISDSSHALNLIDDKLESISESLRSISNSMETFIEIYIENSKK